MPDTLNAMQLSDKALQAGNSVREWHKTANSQGNSLKEMPHGAHCEYLACAVADLAVAVQQLAEQQPVLEVDPKTVHYHDPGILVADNLRVANHTEAIYVLQRAKAEGRREALLDVLELLDQEGKILEYAQDGLGQLRKDLKEMLEVPLPSENPAANN